MFFLLAIALGVRATSASPGALQNYQDGIGWDRCQHGYEFVNGLCYLQQTCASDRFLHTDGLCYLRNQQPCANNPNPSCTPMAATTTTSTTAPPTTTKVFYDYIDPEPPLPPLLDPQPGEQVRCPHGSIYMNGQCRKIICSRGEYHAGRCLSPACPTGHVWRGKRCQAPGYITTILEIENIITNRQNYTVSTENINKVEHVTLPPYNPETDKSYNAQPPPSAANIVRPPPVQPSHQIPPKTLTPLPLSDFNLLPISKVSPSPTPTPDGCCTVKSVRICKSYSPQWVCFNRSQKFCDPRVCTRPVIYLKPPGIEYNYDPPFLVMPPNPPLPSCESSNCSDNDVLDCSGCAENRRENCSAACYNYYCPIDYCQFMDVQDFCELHPGGFGCTNKDGCVWKWCNQTWY